jgi:hypothetical protein
MLSIPRDLYVKLPAVAKYRDQYGKINAANAYGGPEYAAKVVSGVIGCRFTTIFWWTFRASGRRWMRWAGWILLCQGHL